MSDHAVTDDLLTPEAGADPYSVLARLRERDPVHWSEAHRAWLITRYDDVSAAFQNKALSNDRVRPLLVARRESGTVTPADQVLEMMASWMVVTDPPAHTRLRKLAAGAFKAQRISAMSERVAALVDELLDAFVAGGDRPRDLITEVAYPLPATVIATMLGAPVADRDRFREWSDELALVAFGTGGAARAQRHARALRGLQEMDAYFRELIAQHRDAGGRDAVGRGAVGRGAVGREAVGREAVGRDDGGRDDGGRDDGGRDDGGRDAGGRDAGGRDAVGRDAGGRDAGGRGEPGEDMLTAMMARDPDSGVPDSGVPDSGVPGAGVGAGADGPGRAGADALSDDELVAMCALLLFAGHETTTNSIANATLALLRHPDQLALLREQPELIGTAVEELLRFDGPIKVLNRWVVAGTEIRGRTISPGERVHLVLASANRDPERFTDPDRLDLTRSPNPHIAFGKGIHACIGAQLARMETRIALGRIVARLPGLRLAGEPEWKHSLASRSMETLPVRHDVQRAPA
jgi:cytochrome P450